MKKVALGKRFRTVVENEIENITLTPGQLGADLSPLLEVCETLSNYINAADKRLADFAKNNATTKRLLEVPGVGPICAVSFYSAVEDPHRFADARSVGAYLGMTPKFRQSGTTTTRSRISRAGNKMTRGHLYLSAGVMLSRAAKKSAIGDWGKALAARKGHKLARIAVARKLAIAMLSVWKRGGDFKPYPDIEGSRRGEAGLDSVLKL